MENLTNIIKEVNRINTQSGGEYLTITELNIQRGIIEFTISCLGVNEEQRRPLEDDIWNEVTDFMSNNELGYDMYVTCDR